MGCAVGSRQSSDGIDSAGGRGERFGGLFRRVSRLLAALDDARQKLAKFREHYNQQRPHSSLADRTPAAFAQQRAALRSPTAPCEPPFAPRLQSEAMPFQRRLLEVLECAKPAGNEGKWTSTAQTLKFRL